MRLFSGLFKIILGTKPVQIRNSQQDDLQKILLEVLRKSVVEKLGYGVTFNTSDIEDTFFKAVIKHMIAVKLNPYMLRFNPMSSGEFSIYYENYPVGKIKLKGRKTYMQVLKGAYDIKVFRNLTLEEYIACIPAWIRYIKSCIRC